MVWISSQGAEYHLQKPTMILGKGALLWENNVHRIKKFEITANFCWIILVGNVKTSREYLVLIFSPCFLDILQPGRNQHVPIHNHNEPQSEWANHYRSLPLHSLNLFSSGVVSFKFIKTWGQKDTFLVFVTHWIPLSIYKIG